MHIPALYLESNELLQKLWYLTLKIEQSSDVFTRLAILSNQVHGGTTKPSWSNGNPVGCCDGPVSWGCVMHTGNTSPRFPSRLPAAPWLNLMKGLKERLKDFENNIFYQTSPDTIHGRFHACHAVPMHSALIDRLDGFHILNFFCTRRIGLTY